MPANEDWPTRELFGLKVHALTTSQVLDIVHQRIKSRRQLLIGVINAAKIVNMRRNQQLADSVRQADLILADGASVVLASKFLRRPLPERVAGIDLMTGMLERGQDEKYRVYCLGASQEVLTKTVARIESDYPGLVIAGHHHGYFSNDQEADIANAIRDANADILFVAMTSPKKEEFLARWRSTMNAPVCHGVGGSFDVLAGKVRRAPGIWQKLGLEWLYRVLQEPRRLWRRYLVTNTLFCIMVLGEMFARKRTSRAS